MRSIEIVLSAEKHTRLVGLIQDNDAELEMVRWKKRPALLVLPGGGYHFISEREGEPIALRFAARGYQTFVLRYSLGCVGDDACRDALEAMRLIRANAEDWHVDPEKVAVAGFPRAGTWPSGWLRRQSAHPPRRNPMPWF